ncbi:glutathione synthase [Gordonia sp. i37]|uniref:glutathione synthase n=1 Tax=Gordonia sp. i37 TaxID=1961707 RepID=UPI00209AB757|nr:glutathione synthase [Gordonia sp. i37]
MTRAPSMLAAECGGRAARAGRPYVFIIDPLKDLQPHHDTSVALMEAAQLAHHRVLVTEIGGLSIRDGRAVARVSEVTLSPAVLADGHWITKPDWYTIAPAEDLVLDEAAAVFMRTDPPVDADYLRATYILDFVDPHRTLMVNSPRSLREANEKLFALRLPHLGPPTIVTADRELIAATVRQWGAAVLKPTDGMGGRGIMMLRPGDPNLGSILDSATRSGQGQVVIQKYLPQVSDGDRRVIVLDGEPVGVIRRLASHGEFRCNMAAGASVAADAVTARDCEICAELAPLLSANGIHFAGIDIIGGMLTEVNVTSPTGIREIDALCGTALGTRVIDWADAIVATRMGQR